MLAIFCNNLQIGCFPCVRNNRDARHLCWAVVGKNKIVLVDL